MKLKNNIALSESGFMFNSTTGDSYSLNETGRIILTLLKDEKNEIEIKSYFNEKYDVEQNVFEQNYYDFIGMLHHLNLLENE